MRAMIGRWYRFYNGYDPLFSRWVTNPYQQRDESLQRYAPQAIQLLVDTVNFERANAGGEARRSCNGSHSPI